MIPLFLEPFSTHDDAQCIVCHQPSVGVNGCTWCFSPQHYERTCSNNECFCSYPMISVERKKRPVFIDLTEDEDAVIAGNPIQCESLSVSSGAKDFIGNIGLARNNAAKLLKALTTGECNIEARIIRSDDGQRCIVLPSEFRLNKTYYWIFIMMPDYETQHVERMCNSKLCVSPNIAKTDLCIFAFAFLYQSVAEEACNELAMMINTYDASDSFQEACARIAKMPRDKKHFL